MNLAIKVKNLTNAFGGGGGAGYNSNDLQLTLQVSSFNPILSKNWYSIAFDFVFTFCERVVPSMIQLPKTAIQSYCCTTVVSTRIRTNTHTRMNIQNHTRIPFCWSFRFHWIQFFTHAYCGQMTLSTQLPTPINSIVAIASNPDSLSSAKSNCLEEYYHSKTSTNFCPLLVNVSDGTPPRLNQEWHR